MTIGKWKREKGRRSRTTDARVASVHSEKNGTCTKKLHGAGDGERGEHIPEDKDRVLVSLKAARA